MATPDTGKPSFSDSSDTEDVFASPSRTSKQPKQTDSHSLDSNDPRISRNGNGVSKYDTEQTRNALLQKELDGVRSINEVIEGVVSSLECAKGNMEVSMSLIILLYIKYISQT
jgi:hypothetical protein